MIILLESILKLLKESDIDCYYFLRFVQRHLIQVFSMEFLMVSTSFLEDCSEKRMDSTVLQILLIMIAIVLYEFWSSPRLFHSTNRFSAESTMSMLANVAKTFFLKKQVVWEINHSHFQSYGEVCSS